MRRASPGYTTAPFPCCGAVVAHGQRPKETGLCGECAALIKEGRAARAAREAAATSAVYAFRKVAHGLSYTSVALAGDHARELQAAFWQMGQAISTPATNLDYTHVAPRLLADDTKDVHQWSALVIARADQRDALSHLFSVVRACIAAAREDGKQQGRNLLHGLATGELSVSDFNERTEAKR